MSPVHDPQYSASRWEKARQIEAEQSAQADRMQYLIPLIMLAIGAAIGAGIPALQLLGENGLGAATIMVGGYGVYLALCVGAGLVGLLVACSLFGSGAGYVPLALLRLAGIFAIATIVPMFLGGCFGTITTLALIVGLVAVLFEMEVVEGLVVALVMSGVFIGIFIFLAQML
jgi:hypothetical protein